MPWPPQPGEYLDLVAAVESLQEDPGGGLTPSFALALVHPEPRAHLGYDTQAGEGPFGCRFPTNVDGNWIEMDVVLAAGEYAVQLCAPSASYAPIVTLALNDGDGLVNIDDPPYNASAATVDLYSGSELSTFIYDVCDDLTIPADGVYAVRITTTGKNASSSGYFANPKHIAFQRHGAILGQV